MKKVCMCLSYTIHISVHFLLNNPLSAMCDINSNTFFATHVISNLQKYSHELSFFFRLCYFFCSQRDHSSTQKGELAF